MVIYGTPQVESLSVEGLPLVAEVAGTLPDRVLFALNCLLPPVLPPAVAALAARKDHHLLITAGDFGGGELARFEERLACFLGDGTHRGDPRQEKAGGEKETASLAPTSSSLAEAVFLSSEGGVGSDVARVSMFRFAAAPAFRTFCVGEGLQGLSLDYALPKNFTAAPALFDDAAVAGGGAARQREVLKRMRYSHFGCNVVHEDIAFAAGVDVHARKMAIKKRVERGCGGRLPAEHGHGTEYHAPDETRERWERIDPRNVMNPGVGQLDTRPFYGREGKGSGMGGGGGQLQQLRK